MIKYNFFLSHTLFLSLSFSPKTRNGKVFRIHSILDYETIKKALQNAKDTGGFNFIYYSGFLFFSPLHPREKEKHLRETEKGKKVFLAN
jgi:hypothetical protein